jgi:predicted transcriptional regulator
MQFFTADDVLSHSTAASPDEPVTVNIDDSIQTALEIMLENDFDQLPVESKYGIEGVVTSINTRVCKNIGYNINRVDRPKPES